MNELFVGDIYSVQFVRNRCSLNESKQESVAARVYQYCRVSPYAISGSDLLLRKYIANARRNVPLVAERISYPQPSGTYIRWRNCLPRVFGVLGVYSEKTRVNYGGILTTQSARPAKRDSLLTACRRTCQCFRGSTSACFEFHADVARCIEASVAFDSRDCPSESEGIGTALAEQ